MANIRLFAFLDEYKMYSISSQVFEGLTEYALHHTRREKQDSEEQRGPVGSGRLLADIVSEQSGVTEKRFFHDYAYHLFEERLLASTEVLEINSKNAGESWERIADASFVRVTGRAVFNDVQHLTKTIGEFNTLGEALTYITTQQQREIAAAALGSLIDSERNRDRKAELRKQLKESNDIAKIAKDSGLAQDPVFMEKLVYMLNYGFQGQFEVQMPFLRRTPNELLVSAVLDRKYLKESEGTLIRKYARSTEKEFTILGVVTQSRREAPALSELGEVESTDEFQPASIKEAVMYVVEKLTAMEETFIGRLSREIIVDPIALYREL